MANRRREPVVVIGLGRYGSALALELVRRGTEVLAIDSRPKAVQSIADQVSHSVTADATDIEVLRQLNVDRFYRAVIAIGTDLEASVLVTSMLAELGVEDIWAKAISTQHGHILERVGAHHVVFPEHDMGERTAHLVSGDMLDYVQIDKNFAMVQAKPSVDIVDVPLGDTKLRAKFGVTVVAVKHPGEDYTYAAADTELTYDDIIAVVGKIEDIDRFTDSL